MKDLLLAHLKDYQNSWSLGAFGALGEFTWDEGEELLIAPDDNLTIATSRGALRVDNLEQCQPIAYETARRNRDHWSQTVAFCFPEDQAAMAGRACITELGPDTQSILEAHRDEILFDMGLGTTYVDVCVRTANPELIAALRAAEGSRILEPGNTAMMAVLRHSPHRVFVSRLGRLEVFQAIGVEKSPEGPHTHVLPKLLATGLHHAAKTPIPNGMISGLMLYPANPCVNVLGHERDFDLTMYQSFQATLADFGLPEYLTEKAQVQKSFAKGMNVDDYPTPNGRLGRIAARVALRQLSHQQVNSENLTQWRARFDRPKSEHTQS